MNLVSNSERSEDLPAVTSASSIASFHVKSLGSRFSLSPNDFMYSNTTLTSQNVEYFGVGGFALKIPAITALTSSCCPTGILSILGCKAEIFDLKLFIVE